MVKKCTKAEFEIRARHEKIDGEYLGKVFTDVNEIIKYIVSKEQ